MSVAPQQGGAVQQNYKEVSQFVSLIVYTTQLINEAELAHESLVWPKAEINSADDGALLVAAPDSTSAQRQDVNNAKSNQVTPALKMVCELRVEPQFELMARNLLFKILDNPEMLQRNDQGELVINGVAKQNTNFNALFSIMVERVHNLQQPGMYKVLGALRQIRVKSNELSG